MMSLWLTMIDENATWGGTVTRPVDPVYGVVGAAVREAREVAGLSQQALADAVGLTRTSITNLEQGRQQVPLHVLYALASVLGIPLKSLIPDSVVLARPTVPEITADDVQRWESMVTRRAGSRPT